METTHAILLRRIRFSETSLIVSWLSEEHGKIKTMAKGALRPKSAFAGKLDLFFEAEIGYARGTRSEIHTLREVELRNPFDGLRRDYVRVEMASYFVELLELTTELEHPVPELFDLLRRALTWLEAAEPSRKGLLHFESELARLLGVHTEGAGIGALGRLIQRMPESRRTLLEKLPKETG